MLFTLLTQENLPIQSISLVLVFSGSGLLLLLLITPYCLCVVNHLLRQPSFDDFHYTKGIEKLTLVTSGGRHSRDTPTYLPSSVEKHLRHFQLRIIQIILPQEIRADSRSCHHQPEPETLSSTEAGQTC